MKTIPGFLTIQATEEGLIFDLEGKEVRQSRKNGYMAVRIEGKYHYVHKLVNLAFNGIPDTNLVTNHIDGNKINNHYTNLEWVTYRHNTLHFKKSRNKTSKYPGVSLNKKNGKWRAQIWLNGVKKNLGYYANEEDAYNTYLKALNEDFEFSKYSQIKPQKKSLITKIMNRIS